MPPTPDLSGLIQTLVDGHVHLAVLTAENNAAYTERDEKQAELTAANQRVADTDAAVAAQNAANKATVRALAVAYGIIMPEPEPEPEEPGPGEPEAAPASRSARRR